MTEKKYIDAEAWLKQCNPSWMYTNLAKKIIAEAPVVEMFGQWVEVTDHLPTEPDEYIVMIAGAASSTVLNFDTNDAGEGVWYTETEDSTTFYKVTHWMPLPEAPEKYKTQKAEHKVQETERKATSICKCRSCGAEIVWITMQGSGKKMPCDAVPIRCREDKSAKTSFVLPGGIVKRGREGRHPNGEADFVGYRSHFETCPQGTFASAAGGRRSEQKGVAAVAEGEGAKATEARCGNGNRDNRFRKEGRNNERQNIS